MPKQLNRTDANVPANQLIKVLQFGEGNFLRGFADWIIDIVNEKTNFNGGIQIVQPLPHGMTDQINQQEGLYHILLNGIQQGKPIKETRLITSVRGSINPFVDFEAYLKSAENDEVKFVLSNTTEAGIAYNENDKDYTKIAGTFPGMLTQWLYNRFNFYKGSKNKGLIFLPCELIEKNGEALRETILRYANQWGLPPAFKSWIEQHNTFCNTLVDRIVPGFPKENIEEIWDVLGFQDALVVKAELFHLWVIEGPEFIKEIFPVDKTNLQVKFTSDLAPYRTRKVRILNGAHTAMVPIAYLKGLRTVQETVEDNDMKQVVSNLIFDEIIPTLDLPETELQTFAKDVLERFRNPFIRHELISISLNSISKFKVRVLPTILEYKKRKGVLPPILMNSFAQLIIFYRGHCKGENIALNDSPDVLLAFKEAWSLKPDQMVNQILSNTNLWENDLTKVEGMEQTLVKLIHQSLKTLEPIQNII
jgi:tagaturonate reductase